MAEVLFYHLTASPVEANLPDLLEKSLARGWKVIVRAGSGAVLETLDAMLWTYRDDRFIPHATSATEHAARQPIYLTLGPENPNGATVLMLVDRAPAACTEMASFERTCVLFDGADTEALARARDDWRAVASAGLARKYWAQESGRWVQKSGS